MKANEILPVLNQFKGSSYQKILINGSWGIGKTKYVSEFIDTHSNACYVSLFGKKDVNSITQEIYFRIIEKAPIGKIKKNLSLLRKKLNNFNVSLYGISLSIPVLENIHNALNKELDNKETFMIFLDDLERKHSDLNIKEIFGVIDSLSKINNIKIVLIAATDQLEDGERGLFDNYQEKALDRIYNIDEYSLDAPVNILGIDVWNVIEKVAVEFKFGNLRTYEKTNLFITEVIDVLGEEVWSDKFSKRDVWRMCFATVIFITEHNGKKILLESEDENDYLHAYYNEGADGTIDYLCNYILKNTLENNLSKNVFHQIIDWYSSGTFSKLKLFQSIDFVNNYESKPHNFFSSESELKEIVEYSRELISSLKGDERLEDIISNLSNSFTWCDILSINFGLSDKEILTYINKNITSSINIEKGIHDNVIDLWYLHVESEKAYNIAQKINEQIESIYYDELFKQINKSYTHQYYKDYRYLRRLIEGAFNREISDSIKEKLITKIIEGQYFFPIPSGKITEEQWEWCHLIVKLIASIENYWKKGNFFDDFKNYIYSLKIIEKDKMLHYRLNQLFQNK